MIFANYNPKNCIRMYRSLFVKPGNFFLQKFEKFRNVLCWDSLASGLLGPLLLKSLGVRGWFYPKTFQGLHSCFLGHLVGRYIFELYTHETNLMKKPSVILHSCVEKSVKCFDTSVKIRNRHNLGISNFVDFYEDGATVKITSKI